MGLRLFSALSLLLLVGCEQAIDSSDSIGDKTPATQKKIVRSGELTEENQKLREEVFEEILRADKLSPPKSAIDFPTVEGWTIPEPRALPADGLSVAYNHESGMTLTLYQFTRGLSSISDDINSDAVRSEFANSRAGMVQAVEMGLMDSLELEDEGVVNLGESPTQAHWARYLAKAGGMRKATEVFLWSTKNQFLKIRLTSSPRRSEAKKAALIELLTAIGNAS